jgi:hypothetical protein
MDWLLGREQRGPLHLRTPAIASLVEGALFEGAAKLRFYEWHAYVVMANHVHLLITPEVDLAKIAHSLKRFPASEANRLLNLVGKPF